MKCRDARFALAADPSSAGAEVAAHLDSRASCAAYAQDMLMLDGKLREALRVPAPEIALPGVSHRVKSSPRRWFGARQLALAASSCWVRGRYVPRLVVLPPGGPATIMVLPDEKVAGRVAFDEGAYRGVIVPAQRGAIAVLARDPSAVDADAIAGTALAAISYLD